MNTDRLLRRYLYQLSLMVLLGAVLGMALYAGRQRERAHWAKQRIAADEAKIQSLQKQSHLDQQRIRDLEERRNDYESKDADTSLPQAQCEAFESNEITAISAVEREVPSPYAIDWKARIQSALK